MDNEKVAAVNIFVPASIFKSGNLGKVSNSYYCQYFIVFGLISGFGSDKKQKLYGYNNLSSVRPV
ncbi:MAG: hypothetical protein DWB56_00600 [Candidatus Jettenia sp.]|uniref:Uncharacterized protein n=1 Tax=Candidatus Jettenia caeni TaxID=247490 RepID=I3IJ22_9BACT|nr:hypothetical protein [Candidatus Jettenia sp. AMX1]MBC6927452.1 hypothetical protein [Candidatus Jettenia sp.]NUN23934.1 hypothetical protein [Candidatus Jettenia caeni]KAA0249739.1 MAG: hypothetical protein EDM77_07465 [Candidatus Jettenia sp. AMX1]MCE7879135.1 hypothetical protein [Candidatus Jettenia sp. AMX1]MCQ3925746.1 hypothetical protein [Candidatus Jettenia sp.]